MALELVDVTLVAIDTANHALALRALGRSRANVHFARTLFLTDKLPTEIDVPDGVEIATIGPLASREAYSEFVLKGMSSYVATTHALLVQWDGYVINPLAWEAKFLDCDYIGAKWFWQPEGRRVGNGGFSRHDRGPGCRSATMEVGRSSLIVCSRAGLNTSRRFEYTICGGP